MRKIYFRSLFFACVLMLSITSVNAQKKENLIKQKIAGSNGNPTLIVFNKSSVYKANQSKQVLKNHLNLSQNDAFKTLKSEQDKVGFIHEKNQQYFKGVKVEFGTYTIHSKNGQVKSMSGEFYETNSTISIAPKLSKDQAFQFALRHVGAQSYLWEDIGASKELGYTKPEGDLVLLPIFNNLKKKESQDKLRLAYKYEIFTIKPLGGADVYVDAQTGKVLFYNTRVKHVDNFGHDGRNRSTTKNEYKTNLETLSTALVAGSAQTRYSGTQSIETTLSGGNYTLNDASRKVYTRNANNQAPGNTSLPYINNYTEFTDNDNNWTAAEFDNANKDNAALDAHWGAMMTYDYWQSAHGRNSYDNAGSQLRSYVHVDNDYNNAFWYFSVMSYGDGSSNGNEGNGAFDALTSIDIAAHEIGHAVTETTANLVYEKESGAMNEGFSDIWGASVEHFAKGNGNDTSPDAAIWLMGDEIDRRTGSAALRSMSDPKSLGQPDTYQGTNWVSLTNCTPSNNNDHCGVHTNSGVLNHWFYLLTVGGSGTNDIGSSYNVSGIGMTKAQKVAYRIVSVYLSANSTYADARTGGIQAAKDLYGAGSAEEIAVTNAWYAVGIGSAYGATANYCTSASTNVNDEYISRVQLNTIDKISTAQFYSDFTSVSTDLSKNTQYTITVTPTWTGTVYNEGYAVWVDYNSDGDFDDSGELVFSKSASKTTPVSGTFTVPTSATDGATRMRVSMKYNGVPTACETFTYGEVEDYTINIGGSSGADTEAPTTPTSLAASSITETTATLTWNASTDNVGVTGYEVFQGTTSIGTVTGTSANITGLTTNTSYTFSVKAKDAAGNVSTSSNSVTFTTGAGADTEAPSTPGSLATANIAQTSVDLSWSTSTDNVGVTGYDVYQDGVSVSTVTGTSTTISGLTASTNYAFHIVAKDAAGNSSTNSNTANITTLSGGGGGSTQVLFDGSFETGWEGWTDGGGDCYRYNGSRSYDGNKSIRIRDNSSTASSMTLSNANVNGYDNIEIVFYFYAYSMESGEDFWVRYHDGSSWNTVASYASGTSFNNNSFYTATVNISAADYAFPSNAKFRFQCDASSNADQIYIDKVKITATSGGGSFAPNSIASLGSSSITGFVGADSNDNSFEIDGIQLSPNPTSTETNLKMVLDIEDENAVDVRMNIYNIQGRLIQSEKWNGISNSYFNKTINVSKLQHGLYFVNITTTKGFSETQKLIIR